MIHKVTYLRGVCLLTFLLFAIVGLNRVGHAEERKNFTIASSIYVGWMPWYLAAESGLLQEKAQARGISINFVPADYVESINLFVAGHADAVTLTNIDALAIVAAANVEADIVLIGSYSNGNDAIFLSDPDKSLEDAKTIGLVPYSVSHYLLDRVVELEGIQADTLNVVSVNDPDIAGAYFSGSLDGVVTWNPIVLQLEATGAARKHDSRAIPKEIADVLLIRRSVLETSPNFAQALLDTWFTTTKGLSSGENPNIDRLGTLSGADGASYRQQLETTLLLDDPADALEELTNGKLVETTEFVRQFIQRHGLAPDMSAIHLSDHQAPTSAMITVQPNPLEKFLETSPSR